MRYKCSFSFMCIQCGGTWCSYFACILLAYGISYKYKALRDATVKRLFIQLQTLTYILPKYSLYSVVLIVCIVAWPIIGVVDILLCNRLKRGRQVYAGSSIILMIYPLNDFTPTIFLMESMTCV